MGSSYTYASKLFASRAVRTPIFHRVFKCQTYSTARGFQRAPTTRSIHDVEIFEKPLVDRAGRNVVSLEDLKRWRAWARSCADRAAAKIQHNQSLILPKLESLYLEIDWILQDAIVTKCDERDGDHIGRFEYFSGRGGNLCGNSAVLVRENLAELQFMWERRLLDRVPFQYTTATCYWRELVLLVTPAVLIPRPETELMIDLARTALLHSPRLCASPWVDLGTGSGALAICLAAEIDKARDLADLPETEEVYVHAVEISNSAAKVARYNVERYDLSSSGGCKIRVHEGSWYEPLKSAGVLEACLGNDNEYVGTFGGIVSNPPYIPYAEMLNLQPEVRYHEPWLALEGGGTNGLEYYGLICKGAAQHLLPGGFILLETGGGSQVKDVLKLLSCLRNFKDVHTHMDYNGVERFVSAWKRIET